MSDSCQGDQFALSTKELADFHKNGFAGPFKVYEPEEITESWAKLRMDLWDRSNAAYSDDSIAEVGTNIANYDRHLDIDFLSQHICRPQIVHKVKQILGPDVLCWRTEFFSKHYGDEGTAWHQADTFASPSGRPHMLWPESEKAKSRGAITVWCAFTDSTERTGCLKFLPGTHKKMYYDESKGMTYHPELVGEKSFFGYDFSELKIDPKWLPNEAEAFRLVMKPGQCVLFWSSIVHGSLPHTGDRNEYRMGFAARYVPPCVRIYPGVDELDEYGGSVSLERWGAVIVAGSDPYGYNRLHASTLPERQS